MLHKRLGISKISVCNNSGSQYCSNKGYILVPHVKEIICKAISSIIAIRHNRILIAGVIAEIKKNHRNSALLLDCRKILLIKPSNYNYSLYLFILNKAWNYLIFLIISRNNFKHSKAAPFHGYLRYLLMHSGIERAILAHEILRN